MAKKKKKLTPIQRIEKVLKKKITVKKILKPEKQTTLHIKKHEPAEYKPIYFKGEWEEAKKTLFS